MSLFFPSICLSLSPSFPFFVSLSPSLPLYVSSLSPFISLPQLFLPLSLRPVSISSSHSLCFVFLSLPPPSSLPPSISFVSLSFSPSLSWTQFSLYPSFSLSPLPHSIMSFYLPPSCSMSCLLPSLFLSSFICHISLSFSPSLYYVSLSLSMPLPLSVPSLSLSLSMSLPIFVSSLSFFPSLSLSYLHPIFLSREERESNLAIITPQVELKGKS